MESELFGDGINQYVSFVIDRIQRYIFKVLETDNFLEWSGRLKDLSIRIRLARCLDKARLEDIGDAKPLTNSV